MKIPSIGFRFRVLFLFSCLRRWNAADIRGDAVIPRSPLRKVGPPGFWVCINRARARSLPRVRDTRPVQGDRRGTLWNNTIRRADGGPCAGGGSQEADGPELVYQQCLAAARDRHCNFLGR